MPDGKHVAAGRVGGNIDLVDVDSGKVHRTLVGERGIFGLDVAPDGRSIVSADRGGRLVQWNVKRGRAESEWVLPGPGGRVRLSPDGTCVLASVTGGRIATWRPSEVDFRVVADEAVDGSAAWLSNDAIAWTSSTGSLMTRSLADVADTRMIDGVSGLMTLARFTGPRFVVGGDRRGTVWLLDLESGSRCVLGTLPGRALSEIATSGDGRFLIVAGRASGRTEVGAAVVWRLPRRTRPATRQGSFNAIANPYPPEEIDP